MAASIPVFDEKLESWDSYQERLSHYFIALDIEDPNKKKSILINCVGPGNYERVRNLCFPSSANDKDYEELLQLFNQIFTPSIVVFKERKIFYDARKHKNEKASNWHERVRRLALNCKFGSRTEQALLDKFVTAFEGIIFDRFCEENTDLTLAKALEIAQRYETSEAAAAPKPPFKKPDNQPKKPQHDNQKHPPNPNQKMPHEQHSNQSGQQTKPKKFFPKHVNRPVTNVSINMSAPKPN